MQILYKFVWSFAILLFIITAIILSLGFILAAALMVSLYGIYRHYIMKRRMRKFKAKPYSYVEAELIHDTIEVKKPEVLKEKVYWIKRQ